MVHWNSSPHPISDVRDWNDAGRLELRPDFQRRDVWSSSARIMLMDTVLRGIPMPKIFLANSVRNGSTYRVVIDGQQRISAILDFLRNKFSLEFPFEGESKGKTFSELDSDTRDKFLSYQIDFNETLKPTDEEVREVYARVNKYTVPLTKQELRRADFPGEFLRVSEELAVEDDLDEVGIFTPADRRRYADVEYVSELLAAMIEGIQDKKKNLDSFYIRYSSWDNDHKRRIKTRFTAVLKELNIIFGNFIDISDTRFKQKADFYTLFLVIDELLSEGLSTKGKDSSHLEADLEILHEYIRPESDISICAEYAIKCVSQANSASSRRWRHSFLKPILAGTYAGRLPDNQGARIFYRICEGVSVNVPTGWGCPTNPVCPVCDDEIREKFDDCKRVWHRSETVYQVANSQWAHSNCLGNSNDWLVLERPKND